MLRVGFRETLAGPWMRALAIAVGRVSSGGATPTIFVTIERDDEPLARIDIHEDEPVHHAFQEAAVWRGVVVVGFGGHVHFVRLERQSVVSHAMSGYFGHLYPLPDRLLVADSERLWCFDSAGMPVWKSEPLGVDGVVVHTVEGDVIEGDGEWDPPGGWRPFKLSLASGERA
jgi:hypothetical protein